MTCSQTLMITPMLFTSFFKRHFINRAAASGHSGDEVREVHISSGSREQICFMTNALKTDDQSRSSDDLALALLALGALANDLPI
jgi:hypothetical protein